MTRVLAIAIGWLGASSLGSWPLGAMGSALSSYLNPQGRSFPSICCGTSHFSYVCSQGTALQPGLSAFAPFRQTYSLFSDRRAPVAPRAVSARSASRFLAGELRVSRAQATRVSSVRARSRLRPPVALRDPARAAHAGPEGFGPPGPPGLRRPRQGREGRDRWSCCRLGLRQVYLHAPDDLGLRRVPQGR